MSQSDSNPSADLLERSLALKAFPPLASLDERVLASLAQHARTRRLAPGERLTTTHPAPRALRLVVSGELRDELRGATFTKHQLVGGPHALALRADKTRLRAESEVVLLELEDRKLDALFEDEFSVLEAMLRGLGRVILQQGTVYLDLAAEPTVGTLGLIERVQLLSSCPELASLGIDILADLGLEGERIRIPRGGSLRLQGAEQYAILLQGSLTDAAETTLGPTCLFGWLEALAEVTDPRRYLARSPSEVMSFEAERFWDRLEDYPERGLRLVRVLARRVE
ncbi:MAG: hypothetical protein KC766_10660 [Myxococcales bacterium]|nr:hypothetical protein [Myxococcales bacterium]